MLAELAPGTFYLKFSTSALCTSRSFPAQDLDGILALIVWPYNSHTSSSGRTLPLAFVPTAGGLVSNLPSDFSRSF